MWCDSPPSRRCHSTARPTHDGTRPSRSAIDGNAFMVIVPFAPRVTSRFRRIRAFSRGDLGRGVAQCRTSDPKPSRPEVSLQTFCWLASGGRTGPVSISPPDSARAVVIGGGVAGCSVAFHLARLGWTDVVLVEQHALTEGTTWHSAGF